MSAVGTPWLTDSISAVMSCLPLRAVGLPVGADHALVDAPGRLDLDVVLNAEQCGQPLALSVGEQVGAGVQGPPGPVERVAGAAAVTVQVLLDPAPAAVQGRRRRDGRRRTGP